jgi:hypothetical protein
MPPDRPVYLATGSHSTDWINKPGGYRRLREICSMKRSRVRHRVPAIWGFASLCRRRLHHDPTDIVDQRP